MLEQGRSRSQPTANFLEGERMFGMATVKQKPMKGPMPDAASVLSRAKYVRKLVIVEQLSDFQREIRFETMTAMNQGRLGASIREHRPGTFPETIIEVKNWLESKGYK